MICVTGITGHSGRFFLQELIQHDFRERIRCIVRHSSDTSALDRSGLKIEKVYGDLCDSAFLEQSLAGVDTLIHIYNIHHSRCMLEAAIKNKVKRAILVHTAAIHSRYKSASSEYRKIETEVTQKALGKVDLTILRPTMIYGDMCDHNISKFIRAIDTFRAFPLIDGGRNLIQPVNARDLGRAYYDVLTNPHTTANKTYDVSGEAPIQLAEVLEMIRSLLGRNTLFFNVPLHLAASGASLLKVMTLGKLDFVEKVLRMGEDRSCSHESAAKDFGYSPMPFRRGLEIEVTEYLRSKTASGR